MVAETVIQQDQAIDIESVVAGFANDKLRTSMELPQLTTGQRKLVKKVIEQHTGLRCESFGFGTERRLHLFKGDKQDSDAASDCSTHAPSNTSPATSLPVLDALAFPPGIMPPPGLEVRNTFVHFDSRAIAERKMQSMPHDMFRQSLRLETMERNSSVVLETPGTLAPTLPPPPPTSAAAAVIAPPTRVAPDETHLALGTGSPVVIDGLVKAPAFNGLTGIVHSFDGESGRYDILLTHPVGSHKFAKLKRANLQLISLPPAPRYAPCLCIDEAAEACGQDIVDFVATPTWEDALRSCEHTAR